MRDLKRLAAVVLVYPVPEVGWDTPNIGIQEAWKTGREVTISNSFSRFISRNNNTIEVLDSIGIHKNLRRVYPHQYLCNSFIEDRCAAIYQSTSFYRDSNHLSNIGASIIVGEIVS